LWEKEKRSFYLSFCNFFNIPINAHIIYTLKSTKFTLKHSKFAPTCLGPFLDHLQGARGQYFMQLLS